VQHAVRDVLRDSMAQFSAKAGGALIVDAHNGEILSLVSLPDFDANAPMRDGAGRAF
jgi:cell division protein FtsI (penicillin-binding protein 3)